MEIKAILFDFDGTLADTMEDLFLAWKKAFLVFGIEIKKEDYFPLEGTKVLGVARIISEKYNLNANFEEIVKLKEEFYLKNNSFSFYPGVEEFIEDLCKKEIKKAIVSASQKEKIEKTVPKDFLRKFNLVITSEDYVNGKPNPEPYLKAASKLEISPKECIVVENSPLGVESAKNAEMFCIGITSTVDDEKLKKADVIIKNFFDLKGLPVIEALLGRYTEA
jgi:beta-phosphoglucomutase